MVPKGSGNAKYRELLESRGGGVPVADLVGFRLVEMGEGTAVFAMEAGGRHHNPMGTVAGGILCNLADAAMGMAFGATLAEDETFTTLELKINFLRPVKSSRLVATARVVDRGRSIGLTECDVCDSRGRLVARATSTCYVLSLQSRPRWADDPGGPPGG